MVPVASASDGGGSIRIPSASCGLVGLKTSRGRNPGIGWGGLGVVHVVSRTVRDTAAFLDATSGPTHADAQPMARPEHSFLSCASEPPGRLRIAFHAGAFQGVRVAPEVIAVVERTAALLEELGHEVVEDRPAISGADLAEHLPRMDYLMPAAVARNLEVFARASGQEVDLDRIEPTSRAVVEMGRKITAMQFLEGSEALAAMTALARPFFETYDAWLTPTVAEVAPPNGSWQWPGHDPLFGGFRMTMFVPPLMTSLANQTGQPAISLPLEQDAATGLPIGVQLYGRYGDEATLLRLAAQLEAARPWADRHPNLAL
jgi:amidase